MLTMFLLVHMCMHVHSYNNQVLNFAPFSASYETREGNFDDLSLIAQESYRK